MPLTVVEDLFPVVQLWDPQDADLHFIRGERLWSASRFQAAVAGQLANVRIDNPPSSQVLAVVERVAVAGTPQIAGGWTGTIANVGGPATARDGRVFPGLPSAPPVSLISHANVLQSSGAASIITVSAFGVNLTGSDWEEYDIVLPPGTSWAWENTVVNTAMTFNIEWREVPLAPQEGLF